MRKVFCGIWNFIKTEAVLSAAVLLAAVSAFAVPPDAAYLDYFDFRTLVLLFCLMAVMAGFRKTGVFSVMAQSLLRRVRGMKSLIFISVMLCFLSSMVITNDVALITFIPFTITVLGMLGKDTARRLIVPVAAMQTIAANLGSMLTPIGNPQNLYLHGISGMSLGAFVLLMLPYTVTAFVFLTAWTLLQKERGAAVISFGEAARIEHKGKTVVYAALFAVCLAAVARVLDYRAAFVIVIAAAAVTDRHIFEDVDYTLLATFAAFFVFVGNMGRIPAFGELLGSIIGGRECLTAAVVSQVISNVPAALLLSGFCGDIKPLIIGVNIGGLGTLIASMASLISFKYVCREYKSVRMRYLLYFTAANLIFLAVLAAEYLILGA